MHLSTRICQDSKYSSKATIISTKLDMKKTNIFKIINSLILQTYICVNISCSATCIYNRPSNVNTDALSPILQLNEQNLQVLFKTIQADKISVSGSKTQENALSNDTGSAKKIKRKKSHT